MEPSLLFLRLGAGLGRANVTWTLPAGLFPAGQSLQIDLEWTRPYPVRVRSCL